MRIGKALTVLLLVISISVFAGTLELPDKVESKTVTVTGYGSNERNSLNNALISAVEQVVGVMVSSDLLVKNAELIEENIKSRSNGFVQTYKTLSVKNNAGTVETTIEAVVQTDKLRNTFKSLGINTIEVDGDAAYAQVVTQNKRQMDLNSYLTLKDVYPPIKDMLKVEPISIDYEGSSYVLRFNVEIDKDIYNKATAEMLSVLKEYSVIQGDESRCYEYKDADRGIQYYKPVPYVLSSTGSLIVVETKDNSYCAHNYTIKKAYESKIYNAVYNNMASNLGSDVKCRIILKDSAGNTIHEKVFPLFNPSGNDIALHYMSRNEDSSTLLDKLNVFAGALYFVYNPDGLRYISPKESPAERGQIGEYKSYSIMPFFGFQFKTGDYAYLSPVHDVLTLGYHGNIKVNDIQKIKQITVEIVK